jgi:hypothetical protein
MFDGSLTPVGRPFALHSRVSRSFVILCSSRTTAPVTSGWSFWMGEWGCAPPARPPRGEWGARRVGFPPMPDQHRQHAACRSRVSSCRTKERHLFFGQQDRLAFPLRFVVPRFQRLFPPAALVAGVEAPASWLVFGSPCQTGNAVGERFHTKRGGR